MISPNELRLDNLLNWEAEHFNAGISKVVSIDRDSYVVKSPAAWTRSDGEDVIISPIPLTPEWLGKLGFVSDIFFEGERPVYYLKEFYIDFDTLQPIDAGFPIAKFKIEYVHQLQNLYHSLTGEELTIKEQA